jgi:hypothetical protein
MMLSTISCTRLMILSDRQVQKFWEIRITGYEDDDYDSDNGVTAHGVRPDSGAATDADADARNAGYGASEREEDTRAGAEQTSGKT